MNLCAGTGRGVIELLAPNFTSIHMHDQCKSLEPRWNELDKSMKKIPVAKHKKSSLDKFFFCDISDIPFDITYDCIFGNWALSYICDKALRVFLIKVHKSLSGTFKGILILKETTRKEDDTYDYIPE